MTQNEWLIAISRDLVEASIPYMVAGSHGSGYYSTPRTTYDIDLVIDPTSQQLDFFLSSLTDRYYASPEAAHEALARKSMFNIIDLDEGYKADLIIRKDRPFSIEEFRRRTIRTLYGHPIPVASAEDIILSKLEWNRISQSERQVRDAFNVAVIQWPDLDLIYLRRWAPELGVEADLERVLAEAKAVAAP